MKVVKKISPDRRTKTAWTTAILCLVAVVVEAPGCASSDAESPTAPQGRDDPTGLISSEPPRAVLLVVADTTRADFVSFGGHYRKTTPYLDRLARKGVVFDNAYAPSSWTVPSMASLFTSLHPTSHGVVVGGFRDQVARTEYVVPQLPESLETLAETFKKAGYRTVGAAANRFLATETGFAQGFDEYYQKARFIEANKLNKIAARRMRWAFGDGWKKSWKDEPAFVWLHYIDPHSPYLAHEPWIQSYAEDFDQYPVTYPVDIKMPYLVKMYPSPDAEFRECVLPLYESELSFLDRQLKKFAKKLKVKEEDVLVIFTSDHGEEFADHDDMGHSHTLYEELVRVPLMFYWPKGLGGGRRIDAPVSLIDIQPTLAELIGVDPPDGAQGQSLVPLLRGEPGDPERPLLFELWPPRPDMQALRRGKWKLIRSRGEATTLELFDLEQDPGETTDLADRRSNLAAELENELDALLGRLPAAPEADPSLVTDPELLEQLRNMGYVDDEDGEN
jgi:arylsulfatase A-like enzyme